jgi:hypothetical protein
MIGANNDNLWARRAKMSVEYDAEGDNAIANKKKEPMVFFSLLL